MNSEIKMSVSSIVENSGNRIIYVQFRDKEKVIEFAIPGCRELSSKGFTEEEKQQLREYINSEQDAIYSLAKGINPIKAFMGKES